MAVSSEHFLGIDFGTSNSYCCLATRGYLSANPIYFHGQATITTSILFQQSSNGTWTIRAFGDKAEEEWGLATPSEKKHLRISELFKPDISLSAQAGLDAEAFLRELADYMKQNAVLPQAQAASDMNVLIGSPAKCHPEHEHVLRSIARHSGLGDIKTVKEPIGALIHHVAARKDVTPKEARRGIVVIDFGGGTCDIAYMLRLEIRSAWGDPMLGGRLFDDLFYQWFLDTNPDANAAIHRDQNDYYVHWVVSREMKERFSITMNRNLTERFTYHVHVSDQYYGALRGVTWDEFTDRASRYSPSREMEQMVPGFWDYCPKPDHGTLNLLKWFEDVLRSGLQNGSVPLEHVQWIILTGGSSAWPFVRDIVSRSMDVHADRILVSPNPQTSVGEGIALLPVIQDLHRTAKLAIQQEQSDKILEIHQRVDDIVDQFVDTSTTELTSGLVDQEILPLLQSFSRTGGKIKELNAQIEIRIRQTQPHFEQILKTRSQEVETVINQDVMMILFEWFRGHGIRHWDPSSRYLDPLVIQHEPDNQLDIDDPIFQSLAVISAVISSTVIGSLLGGGGVALLASGLPGIIMGAVIGVIMSSLSLFMGKKQLHQWSESMTIPGVAARLFFTEGRLQRMIIKCKEKIASDLKKSIMLAYQQKSKLLEERITELVHDQIESLNALDQL